MRLAEGRKQKSLLCGGKCAILWRRMSAHSVDFLLRLEAAPQLAVLSDSGASLRWKEGERLLEAPSQQHRLHVS